MISRYVQFVLLALCTSFPREKVIPVVYEMSGII